MTLNKQLLCVSLLLLSLPWTGAKFLREMDSALKQGQINTLEATSRVLAQTLAKQPRLLNAHRLTDDDFTQQLQQAERQSYGLYCHPLHASLWVDGYDDEWSQVPEQIFIGSDSQQLPYRCAIDGQQLALFLKVSDHEIVYNNPGKSLTDNGDRVILHSGNGRDYIFTAIGHGKVTPRYFQRPGVTYRESKIDAVWSEQPNGYQLEVGIPLTLANGRMGFTIIDESQRGLRQYGTQPTTEQPPWFTFQADEVASYLKEFSQPGLRLRLLTPKGQLLASTGEPNPQQPANTHWLVRKIYRAILSEKTRSLAVYQDNVDFQQHGEVQHAQQKNIHSQWYRLPNTSSQQLLATATPIIKDGTLLAILLAEQSSEQTAQFTDQAFGRLMRLSVSVLALTALSLLIYASWLSWRIRRLSRATEAALANPDSLGNFPQSYARDEIGSLTRNYAELMKRINEYTEYLQNLSRKLSHELRTPLAIIHSSLDNLASQSLDEHSQTYQQRAKDGALRLGHILTAMSEARRVEESIEHAEPEPVNFAQLVSDLGQAYQDIYPEHHIRTRGMEQAEPIEILAMPDLLVQMLDKLVDNATDFCPAGQNIDLHLATSSEAIEISVSNDGPLLPEAMQSQLFDNMVSLRDESEQGDDTHLGLGLHIVQLIVKAHDGRISAYNRADDSGVVFSAVIPRRGIDQ